MKRLLAATLLLALPAAALAQTMTMTVPATGPDGSEDNSDSAWAQAARVQRAEILANAPGTAEQKERFATLIDCARYSMDFSARASFDADLAGRPRNETCSARFNAATEAYRNASNAALPLNEMDRFQYENSGLILDRDELAGVGDGAAQRAYLIGKVEACFARFGGTDALPVTLPAECPLSPEGTPLASP